ncbi:hypothetical protein GPECTOR_80g178 [Gonium pectorale]|uniref:DNA2/NAM7 helicase-like C-terminal domain-containing protein n=1 Tax=Gonium pectorale TaxID=33097 RepID=A0A150G1V3_GONPE|nr:hypothetical protein GPECTOR_80g178 [Gonium pectorale]|eukprot:KXZ43818.1 hypothetical protein GPECTOR_80g178 [Gonium pectorale]
MGVSLEGTVRRVLAALARVKSALHLDDLPRHSEREVRISLLGKYCVDRARIVFCTVSAVGSFLLSGPSNTSYRASAVIVDEAAQLVEAELAIVLARWPDLRLLVLVGDPQQLPSTVLSQGAKDRGYDRSAFERLQSCGRTPVLLDTQYRMHPAISSWPRVKFYESRVRDGPNVQGNSYDGVAKLLGLHWGPYLVLDVSAGREEREQYDDDSGEEPSSGPSRAGPSSGRRGSPGGGGRGGRRGGSTSWCNMHEAAVAAALVRQVVDAWGRLRAAGSGDGGGDADKGVAARMLLQPGRGLSIGVITPYRAQVEAITPRLGGLMSGRGSGAGVGGVSVAVRSVDGFQGQEKDVIVLSMVRANPFGAVGFTADPRRLNVAATRARHGLVVLLHAATMRKNPLWASFLGDAQSRGLLLSADEQLCLHRAINSVAQEARRRADLMTRDLWSNQPWKVRRSAGPLAVL